MSYTGELCRHVLGVSSPVYVPASVADAISITDSRLDDLLSRLTPQCCNVTVGVLCRHAYPKCTLAAGVIKSKPLCRQVVLCGPSGSHSTVTVVRLQRMLGVQRCCLLLTMFHGLCICLCVCWSQPEPLEMLVEVELGPRNTIY